MCLVVETYDSRVLFTGDAWPGLADGSITVTFRTWKRPQARAGGRYRVAGLVLEVVGVDIVAVSAITAAEAARSGAGSLDELIGKLGSDRGAAGPWSTATLRMIARSPGVVSTVLAKQAGMDRSMFKIKVRALKELGLTESLVVGYRLSPRGQEYLSSIE